LLRTLCAARDNLAPRGHIYFDVITPCLALPAGKWRSWTRPTARGTVRQLLFWEPCRRLLQIHVVRRRDGDPCADVEKHVERIYPPAQVADCLDEAGFRLRGVHDEATADVARTCGPRLLFLAQRR